MAVCFALLVSFILFTAESYSGIKIYSGQSNLILKCFQKSHVHDSHISGNSYHTANFDAILMQL